MPLQIIPGMAKKRIGSNRGSEGSLDLAHQASKPPEVEYRFDRLEKENEYEDCFWHEVQRYKVPRLRARIQEELSRLADAAGEPDDPDCSVRKRMQDLAERLEWLGPEEAKRPWLELSQEERDAIMTEKTQLGVRKRGSEPVQLWSNLDVVGRTWLRLSQAGEVEKLEIMVDWSQLDEELTKSFSRLLRWMRTHRGKDRFKVEKSRGPKHWPINHRLFGLAVWRCRQSGMTDDDIWKSLGSLGRKMSVTKKRRLDELSRLVERLIGADP